MQWLDIASVVVHEGKKKKYIYFGLQAPVRTFATALSFGHVIPSTYSLVEQEFTLFFVFFFIILTQHLYIYTRINVICIPRATTGSTRTKRACLLIWLSLTIYTMLFERRKEKKKILFHMTCEKDIFFFFFYASIRQRKAVMRSRDPFRGFFFFPCGKSLDTFYFISRQHELVREIKNRTK